RRSQSDRDDSDHAISVSVRDSQRRSDAAAGSSTTSSPSADRRLRPMLARQFELAAGQRKAKDARAFESTGRMLFGDELWQW
ncbi:hypothetical protein C6A85_09785, partial [Mycobacterium sp. ITM-2017-0098]